MASSATGPNYQGTGSRNGRRPSSHLSGQMQSTAPSRSRATQCCSSAARSSPLSLCSRSRARPRRSPEHWTGSDRTGRVCGRPGYRSRRYRRAYRVGCRRDVRPGVLRTVQHGKQPGHSLESALGVSSQRRKLAAALGIDPYTDFTPLAHRLDQFGRSAAAGGLADRHRGRLHPGCRRACRLNHIDVNGAGNLVRDKTSAQLLDINRARLEEARYPSRYDQEVPRQPILHAGRPDGHRQRPRAIEETRRISAPISHGSPT